MDRLVSDLDARRVMQMLSSNLDKERQMWMPISIKSSIDEGITEQARDEAAAWLAHLAAHFKFLPETCGLAILLMDRVLHLVKVRSKYLQCVAVTCLYIAAKTLEEDENIPSTPDLVRKSMCGCSFAEITRMEMVILAKLSWNVHVPSAVDFLHTIHVVLIMHYSHLLSSQRNQSPSEHLSCAMRKLIRCLTWHGLLHYRPSTVALALISLQLELITPGWLHPVLALQRMTNVGNEEFMQCREVMADFLGHQSQAAYITKSRTSSYSAPQSKKRKVEHVVQEAEDENIYDGIKRLYSEDIFIAASPGGLTTSGDKPALRTSCSLEMHQEIDENTMSPALTGQSVLVN